jgi:DNA-binding Xre family transcriptional regulator
MIAKYFWDLNEASLRETERILRDPRHPRFPQRMVTLLSRCDKPKELFSLVSKKAFVEAWPRIRADWVKRVRRSDSRDWWETIYEQLLEAGQRGSIRSKGSPPEFLRRFGGMIRAARVEKGLSQKQLAVRVGMKQPDISRMEEGKKNMTLFTLLRICQALGIQKLDIRQPQRHASINQ